MGPGQTTGPAGGRMDLSGLYLTAIASSSNPDQQLYYRELYERETGGVLSEKAIVHRAIQIWVENINRHTKVK